MEFEPGNVVVRERRTQRLVLRPVAAGLDEQQGAGSAGEMAHVGQPIRQRLIAVDGAQVFVFARILGLGCPDQKEDRASSLSD